MLTFDGPMRAVHLRVAEQDGRVYLDLAEDHWRAVEIDADGWRVIPCPPVTFRRTPGMLPLPVPARGGSIETQASFCNIPSRAGPRMRCAARWRRQLCGSPARQIRPCDHVFDSIQHGLPEKAYILVRLRCRRICFTNAMSDSKRLISRLVPRPPCSTFIFPFFSAFLN
jgi:hypothetical protein